MFIQTCTHQVFEFITGHITAKTCAGRGMDVVLQCRKTVVENQLLKNNKKQNHLIFDKMKKQIFALAATLAVIAASPNAAAQQQAPIVVKTHFEGQTITGVSASSAFDVELIKSEQTRAVVETTRDIAGKVEISRDKDGVVTIGCISKIRTIDNDRRVLRLKLYLPSINTIRLSGATDLTSRDEFRGEDVDILVSGASDIAGLTLRASRVKIQASGASDIYMTLPATADLVALASGSCDIEIHATGLKYSRVGVSGASDIKFVGTGERGDWTASGASDIEAGKFAISELNFTGSGASTAKVNVSGAFRLHTSGGSSVQNVAVR